MERINNRIVESPSLQNARTNSRYLKPGKEKLSFYRIAVFFLFCYFVLPQYFGLNIPVFDLTAQRIGIIVLFLFLMEKRERVYDLVMLIKTCKITPWLGLFMFVLFYTAVLKTHPGTFLYSFIEILAMFMVMYVIKYVIGLKKTIQIILIFAYILCILGLIEYVMGRSLFSYLETIQGLYTGIMVRSGSYRIMGPANHSLAYGLILITVVPLACVDLKEDRINIFQNLPLFGLLVVNIFLTGSRSTLAVFFLEALLLFLFSAKKEKKKVILFLAFFIVFLAVFVAVFRSTSIGNYILLQISSIIDEVFGTSLALAFGADAQTLNNSSYYRSLLPMIFTLDAFNPLLGKGSDYHFNWFYEGFYVRSIDNYYVATFIRYAYPGLVTYILIMIFTLFNMVKMGIQKHSGLCYAVFIGTACYFVNLWWLDTLQTIKYVYILFAIFFIYEEQISKDGK